MLNSVINLCEKHGFIRKIVSPIVKTEQLKVGPTGCLLLQNLKNEWFYNMVINKDTSVFLSDNNSLQETFQFAKNMCLDKLPFGIAEVIQNKHLENFNEQMNAEELRTLFVNEDQVTLKCTVFTSSESSVPFFHQWQRQRRIWWRKFSPNPGRYSITDIKTNESNVQSVQIVAKYPWDSQVIETLVLYPKLKNIRDSEKFKDGKKSVQCHSIESSVDITTMFINTLYDAYDESDYKGNKRTLLSFHRKLAPYRISFAISSGLVAANVSELSDLALYLTRQLRSNHISTLFLPSSWKHSLDNQWRQYDELGIPYNVLLNEKTLRDGLALLRSRDTTLKEQVHVTELVSYVGQLFKNY